MRIDGEKRPNEGNEYEKYIDRGEQVIFEFKLKIGKGEIENEIEDKGHGDHGW